MATPFESFVNAELPKRVATNDAPGSWGPGMVLQTTGVGTLVEAVPNTGGRFRGTWDMSSGTAGPAAPATDYQTTHTATTVTPSATLTGSGPKYLAASSSPLIPLPSSGIASATLTQPAYAAGDTIYGTVLLITNSSATASDIESLFSGSPPSGLYLAYIALSPYAAAAALGAVNDGTPSSESGASAAAGVVVHATIDYATGVVSAAVGSDPVFGTTNLDLAAITAKGDGLRLWAGVLSTSSSVVFGAGHIALSFSGFTALTDATLPAGALDNDWYEVSAGGYFHGKTTEPGQFVKLISGKTNLIVVASVHLPYSGQFRGTWDMSSGTAGPAVDDAYRATISASGDTYAIAPLTPAETVISATSTLPYGGGWCTVNNEYDLVSGTRYYTMFGFVQENVSAADITAPPTNNPCLVVLIAVAADNSYAAFIYAGDPNDGYTTTITDNQPHPTGGVAEFQCTLDGSDYVISCRFGGVASEVLRYPSAGIGSMKPIVARYYFGASTLPITGLTTGFVNATLPVGALDNDWYEVSAGGYFHGKTTRAGQFVKLIRGKTDLIVVDDPTGLVRSVNGVEPVDGDVTLTPDDVSAASYNAQSLTAAQQIQAQRNIGTQLFFGQDFPTGTVAPAALMKFDADGMWIDFVVRQVTPIWHGYVSSLMLMADTADKVVANTWADPYGYIHDGALRPDGTPQQGIDCTPGNFASFDLSSGDFTIEFFFTPSAYDNTYSYHCGILSFGDGTLGYMRYFLRYIGGAGFQFYVYPSPGSPQIAAYAASVLTTGAEHHIAVQRISGVYSITVNGADMTYEQHNVAPLSPVSIYEKLSLGQIYAGGYSEQMTGSIRQFRMTKGIAVYPTYPFTPPTSFPSII